MKKSIVAAFAVLACTAAMADTYVRPHVTKNGTYVEGHYRSSANSTKTDNYSSQGNTNPYTGKEGQTDPYKPSTSSTYGTQCGVTSKGDFVCK